MTSRPSPESAPALMLREAGFVESPNRSAGGASIDCARSRSWSSTRGWFAFRRFWSKHVDALAQHLDKMDQAERPPSVKKGKKRQ